MRNKEFFAESQVQVKSVSATSHLEGTSPKSLKTSHTGLYYIDKI